MSAPVPTPRQPAGRTTVREEWVVSWFPDDGPRHKAYTSGSDPEGRARRFAAREDVAGHRPRLTHRVHTTVTVTKQVPL